MMLRPLLIGVILMMSRHACGLEQRLMQGLSLNFESLPGSLSADGVPLLIQRASGTGVAELVRRIRSEWHEDGSALREQMLGDWNLLSRLHGSHSEVIQWRGRDNNAEFLWSSVDTRMSNRTPPRSPLPLPAQCIWGPGISGEDGQQLWTQRSARCSRSPHELAAELGASLQRLGWSVRSEPGNTLFLDRSGEQAQISLVLPEGDSLTWLIWLSAATLPGVAR